MAGPGLQQGIIRPRAVTFLLHVSPLGLESVRRRPRRRRHEVVQGAVSLAQPGRGGDRAVHEVERVLHGALEDRKSVV